MQPLQQLCFDDCANPNYKDVVLKVGECACVCLSHKLLCIC